MQKLSPLPAIKLTSQPPQSAKPAPKTPAKFAGLHLLVKPVPQPPQPAKPVPKAQLKLSALHPLVKPALQLPQPAKPVPKTQAKIAVLHLHVKPAPQPPQPLQPAPKAISNIRYKHHVNPSDNTLTGSNVIYDRTNLDGTIDKVERTCDVYAHWVTFDGGSVICPVYPRDIPEVTQYILMCETRLKNHKPANVNVHRCGALLATTRLPPPPPPKPTVDAEIAQLKAQITAQNKQIKALSDQVAASKKLDAAQRQQLIILQQNLQQLQTMLINVLCNNP